ncbi:hypothetical protein SAY87_019466 [Trapa incisa]|uniref:Uncharacterized protein n=1 Tax=Trapa incisa TaxID=236973 RepID=A0AAN7Q7C4_9MYRT|nr:hypothetical protein SAY87_019466 [Trapa incisa]
MPSKSPPPLLELDGNIALYTEATDHPHVVPAAGLISDSMPDCDSGDISSEEPPSDGAEKPPKRKVADEDGALSRESEDADGNPEEGVEASGARSAAASSKKSKMKSNNVWVWKSTRKRRKKNKNGSLANGQADDSHGGKIPIRMEEKYRFAGDEYLCRRIL